MLLRTVAARDGLLWVKQGFVWLFRQPWRALALVGCYLLAVALMSLLPGLGGVLPLFAMQVATVGFMAASRAIDRGEPFSPLLLLEGLRAPRPRVHNLLLLALLYVGAVVAVLLVGSLLDGGTLLRLLLFGTIPSDKVLNEGTLRHAALLASAAYVPLSAAFWLAPVLVSWYGMGPWQALFTSAVIVVRNLPAFIVYATQWFALFVGVPLLLGLLATAAGASGAVSTLIGLPAAIVLMLAFILSFYASARSLLPQD
jgi:hypothetical protein